MKSCPHCGSVDLRYSRRHPAIRALGKVIPVRPFRCLGCKRRLWRLDSRSKERPSFRNLVLLTLVSGALLVALAYVLFLPYATDPPRPPGERSPIERGGQATRPAPDVGSESVGFVLEALEVRTNEEALELRLLASGLPLRFDHFLIPEAASLERSGRLSIDLPGNWTTAPDITWASVPIDHPLAERLRFKPNDQGLHIDVDLPLGAVSQPTVKASGNSLRILLEPSS